MVTATRAQWRGWMRIETTTLLVQTNCTQPKDWVRIETRTNLIHCLFPAWLHPANKVERGLKQGPQCAGQTLHPTERLGED